MKEKQVKAGDFLKWSRISTHLGCSKFNIREDRVHKKYEKDVNELLRFVDKWIKKTEVK